MMVGSYPETQYDVFSRTVWYLPLSPELRMTTSATRQNLMWVQLNAGGPGSSSLASRIAVERSSAVIWALMAIPPIFISPLVSPSPTKVTVFSRWMGEICLSSIYAEDISSPANVSLFFESDMSVRDCRDSGDPNVLLPLHLIPSRMDTAVRNHTDAALTNAVPPWPS